MRVFAYILLLSGFLWLTLWCAGSVASLTRSIGSERFKKYPDLGRYSGNEVCDAIRSALLEYQQNAPGVTFPAALMLVGGVLFDIAGRRGSKQNAPETISLEGPVELINDKLTVRIPLAVGGDRLAPFAKGLGEIDGEHLNVTIQPDLAKKLRIGAGSLVIVHNRRGKFTIARSATREQFT